MAGIYDNEQNFEIDNDIEETKTYVFTLSLV